MLFVVTLLCPWDRGFPLPPNLENPGQTENRPRISGKAVEVSDHSINLPLRDQPGRYNRFPDVFLDGALIDPGCTADVLTDGLEYGRIYAEAIRLD